jgi:hypothetical protein
MTDQVDDCHRPSNNAVTTPIAYCPERGNGTEPRVGRVFAAYPGYRIHSNLNPEGVELWCNPFRVDVLRKLSQGRPQKTRPTLGSETLPC